MPSTTSVHEQLTDILVRVVGCPADAVVPAAVLKDLGTDSLTIVEVGEELGRRFGIRLSDRAIDSMTTVQNAIDAVVGHDGTATAAVTVRAPEDEVVPVKKKDPVVKRGRVTVFAATFVFLGLVIGGVLGLGGAALVSATGMSEVNLPPIVAPTTPAPVVETEDEPAPAATTPVDQLEPTINTSSEQVSPGERFYLSGAFPGSPVGQNLQVQVKDGSGSAWDNFPIQTATRDGGIFRTELYTSRTGERQFRVTNTVTNVSSPSIKVDIG
ncbi:MAG: acyl carrier protein [Aeromicrobium sp.]